MSRPPSQEASVASEPSVEEPAEESGEGLFTFVDGSRYEGQYATEDGVFSGEGTYTWAAV